MRATTQQTCFSQWSIAYNTIDLLLKSIPRVSEMEPADSSIRYSTVVCYRPTQKGFQIKATGRPKKRSINVLVQRLHHVQYSSANILGVGFRKNSPGATIRSGLMERHGSELLQCILCFVYSSGCTGVIYV